MATHWKKATEKDPNFIGSHDLFVAETETYTEKVVTLTGCSFEYKDVRGSKKQVRLATFKECKPLILNATNCKVLAGLFSTPVLENWHGQKLTLYVKKGVKFGDETHDAIRIRPSFAVVQLPTLSMEDPMVFVAQKAIQEGKRTLAGIKKLYTLSSDVEKFLLTPATPAENDQPTV